MATLAFYDTPGVRSERFSSLRDAKAALTAQIERQRKVIEDHDRQADRCATTTTTGGIQEGSERARESGGREGEREGREGRREGRRGEGGKLQRGRLGGELAARNGNGSPGAPCAHNPLSFPTSLPFLPRWVDRNPTAVADDDLNWYTLQSAHLESVRGTTHTLSTHTVALTGPLLLLFNRSSRTSWCSCACVGASSRCGGGKEQDSTSWTCRPAAAWCSTRWSPDAPPPPPPPPRPALLHPPPAGRRRRPHRTRPRPSQRPRPVRRRPRPQLMALRFGA